MEDSASSEMILCQIRLIDADLWRRVDELKAIYSQLGELSAVKLRQKLAQFTDQAIAGNLTSLTPIM